MSCELSLEMFRWNPESWTQWSCPTCGAMTPSNCQQVTVVMVSATRGVSNRPLCGSRLHILQENILTHRGDIGVLWESIKHTFTRRAFLNVSFVLWGWEGTGWKKRCSCAWQTLAVLGKLGVPTTCGLICCTFHTCQLLLSFVVYMIGTTFGLVPLARISV